MKVYVLKIQKNFFGDSAVEIELFSDYAKAFKEVESILKGRREDDEVIEDIIEDLRRNGLVNWNDEIEFFLFQKEVK